MNDNEPDFAELDLSLTLERIANNLERVLVWLRIASGLLAIGAVFLAIIAVLVFLRVLTA